LKLLTLARDLKRRKSRERNTLFVAEGVRLAEELLASGLTVQGAVVTAALESGERGRRLMASLRGAVPEIAVVDEREMAGAAHTDSPQGVLLIADVPRRTLGEVTLEGRARLLLLDAVQDPGNAGTLIRTAAAFGVAATVALPGTVDLWSAKVVRSAMGAHFRHMALHASQQEADEFLEANRVELWGSEAGAPAVPGDAELPLRLALAVGNEGSGLTAQTRGRASRLVGVPTVPGVESLNVTVAAGILLHAMRR
jgi:TrmH family RNA methyltransferase